MNNDRISEVYKGEIWGPASQERARNRIHWMCSRATGERVLDVGCSQGIASILLGREGYEVTGIDIEQSRIEYARVDLALEMQQVQERVAFDLVDATSLPFDVNSFDTVLLGEVLEHLVVPRRVVAEAVRVLRPGGALVITTPFGLSPHHDHKQTFFPLDLVDLLYRECVVIEAAIADGYFRILASKDHPSALTRDEAALKMLEEAAEATEEIQASLIQVREQLTAQRKLVSRLNEDIAKARSETFKVTTGFQKEVEATRSELERERDSRASVGADLRKTRTALTRAKRRITALEGRVDHLEVDRWKLRSRLQLSEWKRRSLLTRRWWLLGGTLASVRRQPLRVVRLPIDLAQLILSPKEAPRRPEPIPRPQPLRRQESSSQSSQLDIPTAVIDTGSPRRSLRVAAIVDEFSRVLFGPEFELIELTPSNWSAVLAEEPDFLLVESAWKGKDDLWRGNICKVADPESAPSELFREVVSAFRAEGIPTVFWNKEDPPNYDLFVRAASLFDYVFTVAEECIPKYRNDLGHDRIYLLPFSAQPKVHNPVSVGKRKLKPAFAGSYYAEKHPARREQMQTVLTPALDFGLEIFARPVPDDPRYRWPDLYQGHLVGSLSYEQMVNAYKLYELFLNVNSVTDSDSMCARRIFELAAAGTPIISGVSPAIEKFFGDSIIQVGNSEQATSAYMLVLRSEVFRRRMAQQALRAVMRYHTASHRVDEVLRRIGLSEFVLHDQPALVSVVVPTKRPHLIDHIVDVVARQSYPRKELVLICHGFDVDNEMIREKSRRAGIETTQVFQAPTDTPLGANLNLGFEAAVGDYIAKMDDDDYYGSEYLHDQIDAFGFADTEIVGKWTYHAYFEGFNTTILRFPGNEHQYTNLVHGGTIVVRRGIFPAIKFPELPRGSDTGFLAAAREEGLRIYSTDRFNFCYMRSAADDAHTYRADDLALMSSGHVVTTGFLPDMVIV